jgi:hypothetical protein
MGWSHQKTGSWDVYALDTEGVELSLPDTEAPWEAQTYSQNAIGVISAIYDESEIETSLRVRHFDRDIMRVRITDVSELDLKTAAREINNLESLVRDAAANEYKPKPVTHRKPKIAEQITESFQFGHTFPGSFGFTILSGKIVPRNWDKIVQPRLFEDEDAKPLPPFSRRVVERIFRSLHQLASEDVSEEDLAESYTSASNSNMLKSLEGIIGSYNTEFQVRWSPRIPVAAEFSTIHSIELGPQVSPKASGARYLLRQLAPVETTVSGKVISLTSEDPLDADGSHEVTIKARLEERDIKVHVSLRNSDYSLALDAHQRNIPVSVDGLLSKSGTYYRLRNPSNFRFWTAPAHN